MIDSSSADNFISESEINKNISEEYIYILDIVDDTCVDGPGLRTSVYSSGCSHKCPGCQNPKSWNLLAGRKMKVSDIKEYLIKSGRNITFSGGDPFFQVEAFTNLAKMIKKESNKNIWCYTGYTFEEIIRNNDLNPLLSHIDILIDGRFEDSLKSTDCIFRGSSNQRIIDVQKSIKENKIFIYNYNPIPVF